MLIDISITLHDWQSSDGDSQTAVLRALECSARSHWRAVCPIIFVECIEPYRTLVLRRETLENLQERSRSFSARHNGEASTRFSDQPLQIAAEVYTPLADD